MGPTPSQRPPRPFLAPIAPASRAVNTLHDTTAASSSVDPPGPATPAQCGEGQHPGSRGSATSATGSARLGIAVTVARRRVDRTWRSSRTSGREPDADVAATGLVTASVTPGVQQAAVPGDNSPRTPATVYTRRVHVIRARPNFSIRRPCRFATGPPATPALTSVPGWTLPASVSVLIGGGFGDTGS